MTQPTYTSWALPGLLFFLSLCAACQTKTYPIDQNLQATRLLADSLGIDTSRYVAPSEKTNPARAKATLNKLVTEIYYGQKPADQSFAKLTEVIDTALINQFASSPNVLQAIQTNQRSFAPYKALVVQYQQARKTATSAQLQQIQQTLNFYRYLNRFADDERIIVNIPAARLAVYDKAGNRQLPMAVIVGKADKATPRFNCQLTDIIAYPYWNVPEGIAIKEILPKIRASTSYLDSQNMEILDRRDQPVDPETIDWETISAKNFPYRVRQTSGCHNSLGLIKFNLNGPPAIYLHDTNARQLFNQTTDHWRSHGCVRVEKPVELANYVLGTPKFDQGFYDRCLTDQTPKSFKLPKPVAVFVTYNLADVDERGQLVYYKDVYGINAKLALR